MDRMGPKSEVKARPHRGSYKAGNCEEPVVTATPRRESDAALARSSSGQSTSESKWYVPPRGPAAAVWVFRPQTLMWADFASCSWTTAGVVECGEKLEVQFSVQAGQGKGDK